MTACTPDEAARRIARSAVCALHAELELAPKPGLVSFVDSGSHTDMDARSFIRSIHALRPYFHEVALLGIQRRPFMELERAGMDAERAMLRATGGVNTHRGAIFTLGLLCAATGAHAVTGALVATEAGGVRAALLAHWGEALLLRRDARRDASLPGARAARAFGLRSASDEAAAGFPVVFDDLLPVLRGPANPKEVAVESVSQRRVDALMLSMLRLDDCNLVHRGGIQALADARAMAADYLARGGAANDRGFARAWAMHRHFVSRRLSAGGCADALAAACFVQSVGTQCIRIDTDHETALSGPERMRSGTRPINRRSHFE